MAKALNPEEKTQTIWYKNVTD